MMDDRMDRTIDEVAAEYNRPPEAPREEMWRRIEAARRDRAAGRPGGSAAGAVILPFRRRAGRFAIPIAAAAVLALAFGLGRVSVDDPAPPAPRVASGSSPAAPVPGTSHDSAAAVELASEAPDGTGASDAPGAREATGATSVPDGAPSDAGRPAAQPPSRQLGAPPGRQLATPPSDALALAAREHLAQAETFLVLFRASINAGQRVEPVVPATARYLLASNRLLIDSPAAEEPGMRRLLSDVELVLAQIAQMPADSADTTDERLITDGIAQRDLLLRIRTAAGNARGMPNQGVL